MLCAQIRTLLSQPEQRKRPLHKVRIKRAGLPNPLRFGQDTRLGGHVVAASLTRAWNCPSVAMPREDYARRQR